MVTTLEGINTIFKWLQPPKASAPMLVTPSGIITLVRLVHH